MDFACGNSAIFFPCAPANRGFFPNEIHAIALEFHELLGNKHIHRPWTREIDIEERFEASGTACQNSHARAAIDGLIDVMSHVRVSHTVFAPDIQQKFLHHQARLGIKGAVNIQHSGVFMAHLLRGEICGRFSPALFSR